MTTMDKKTDAAKHLAQLHYDVEPGMQSVFRLTGSAEVESRLDEPIKLLEVNRDTIESGIYPIYFGPAPDLGVDFPIVIIEVTPSEFAKIQSSDLPLPHGWKVGDSIPRSNGHAVQNGHS
jgi:hypothetical protein